MERVATSKLKALANGRRWEAALQMLIELPKQEMEVGQFTPPKSNMSIPKNYHFKRVPLPAFQTIILGIRVGFQGCNFTLPETNSKFASENGGPAGIQEIGIGNHHF